MVSADGSDWQQTDVEDQLTDINQPRGSELQEPSQHGQNQNIGQSNPVNPTFNSSGNEPPQIYVINNINNMVLKQVRQMKADRGDRNSYRCSAAIRRSQVSV